MIDLIEMTQTVASMVVVNNGSLASVATEIQHKLRKVIERVE
jgi:hypothetical protein